MLKIKLGTFTFEEGCTEAGILVGEDKVAKLAEAYAEYVKENAGAAVKELPADMVEMMKLGQAGTDAARSMAAWLTADKKAADGSKLVYDLAEVKTKNPVMPTKIICIGRSFPTHVQVGGLDEPDCPHIFLKPLTSMVDPYDDVDIPIVEGKPYDKVTYGCELTAVIGSEAKYCTEENVMDHVAGWTVFNDVTCRGMLYPKNKMFDKFAPFGPYIIPADQLENADATELKFKVDGEWKQEGNTKNMYWSVEYILADLTQHMTLCPGDIIALGDIGAPETINAGETMEAIIPEIGVLRNKAVNEK